MIDTVDISEPTLTTMEVADLVRLDKHLMSKKLCSPRDWEPFFIDNRERTGSGYRRRLSRIDVVVVQMLVDTSGHLLAPPRAMLAEQIRRLWPHRPVEIRVFPKDEMIITYQPDWSHLDPI